MTRAGQRMLRAVADNQLIIAPGEDERAAKIGWLYRKGYTALIECGQELIDVKASLNHGEWLPWLKDNAETLGFSARQTASRLMALASNVSNGALTHHLDIWDNNTRGTQGTGENEWHTPQQFLEHVRAVLGTIDLDPASSAAAQRVVKAEAYFNAAGNGLTKEWNGKIWLNPPYAQPLIAEFVDKMIAEVEARNVKEAIMLTHNYTDTTWFQDAARVAKAICFTRGRIRFVDPEGNLAAPTQGQAFFYFGNRVAKFIDEFYGVG